MTRFTEKRKTIQEAAAYAAYMIVGSYFNKEKCRNQLAVDRLYLYYKEQGANKQEMLEAGIIAQADVSGKYFSRKKGIYFSRNAANYFP